MTKSFVDNFGMLVTDSVTDSVTDRRNQGTISDCYDHRLYNLKYIVEMTPTKKRFNKDQVVIN